MHLKTYDFSGIKIGVRCEKELAESENLRKFRCTDSDPDYMVTVEFCPQLTNDPEGESTEFCCRRTKTEANQPEQIFVRSDFSDGGCRMRVLDMYTDAFEISSALRHMPLNHALIRYKAFVLHASCVLINGEAVLFSAPCGTGKSTQAELWKKHRGARIVNGDRTIVRCTENGITAGGIYYSGTSGYCENITAPLKAIVLLGQAKESRISRCGGGEALRRIFRECTCTDDFEDDPAKIAGIVADVVNSVPVYKLDCLPDETAVVALEEVLYGS